MDWKNVYCPICGKLNEGVNLEETDGWVECVHCKTDFKLVDGSNDPLFKLLIEEFKIEMKLMS